MANLKNKVKEWREYILLFVTILEVATIALAAYVSNRLAPLEQNIAVLSQEVKANDEQHANFVTKDAFAQLVDRIDHISTRVDQIYQALIRIRSGN